MNQSEYAKHLGISQQRVSKMLKQGIISSGVVVTRRGSREIYDIDPEEADVDYEENRSLMNRPEPKLKKKKAKGARKPKLTLPEVKSMIRAVGESGATKAESERIIAQCKAILIKSECEKESGKLILASEVAKDGDRLGRLINERLTAVSPRVAPLVAPLSDPFQCEQVMKKEINQILEEVSKEALK